MNIDINDLKCRKSNVYIAAVLDGDLLVILEWLKHSLASHVAIVPHDSLEEHEMRTKELKEHITEILLLLEEVGYVCNQTKLIL